MPKGQRGVRRIAAVVGISVVSIAIVYLAVNDTTIIGVIDDILVAPAVKLWWDCYNILASGT